MAAGGFIDDGLLQLAENKVAFGGAEVGLGADVDSNRLDRYVVLAARVDGVGDELQITRFTFNLDAVAGNAGRPLSSMVFSSKVLQMGALAGLYSRK